MSNRGLAMSGRANAQPLFFVWGAAIGEDFEVLDVLSERDEAELVANAIAVERKHQFVQVTKGRRGKVVRRFQVEQEVA